MRHVLAFVIVLAGLSSACKKDRDLASGGEPRINLSKMSTLLELGLKPGEAFPEAPACTGVPPVNEFSVPRSPVAVAGKRYQPAADDWSGPWMEFHFAINSPIQALYCYESDGRSFTLHASLDTDGDGVWAHYQRRGELLGEQPAVGPLVVEREGE